MQRGRAVLHPHDLGRRCIGGAPDAADHRGGPGDDHDHDDDAAAAKAPTTTTGRPAPAVGRKLALRAGGLDDIEFGAPAATTLKQLEAKLGPTEGGGPGHPEICPGYRIHTWHDRDTAVFFTPEGALAGWEIRSAASGATAEGVTVGSDVATLRRAYGPQLTIEETSLGEEFTVAEKPRGERTLSGIVEGPGDAAKIIGLWSGYICAAR